MYSKQFPSQFQGRVVILAPSFICCALVAISRVYLHQQQSLFSNTCCSKSNVYWELRAKAQGRIRGLLNGIGIGFENCEQKSQGFITQGCPQKSFQSGQQTVFVIDTFPVLVAQQFIAKFSQGDDADTSLLQRTQRREKETFSGQKTAPRVVTWLWLSWKKVTSEAFSRKFSLQNWLWCSIGSLSHALTLSFFFIKRGLISQGLIVSQKFTRFRHLHWLRKYSNIFQTPTAALTYKYGSVHTQRQMTRLI